MFLDICLSVWSLLAQALPAGGAEQATQAVQTAATTAPQAGQGLGFFRGLLMGVYLLVCCGLVIVVLGQNSKNDGLAGMLGGGGTTQQSSYHGKKSTEEIQKMVGNYLAVSFIVLSLVVSLIMH